MKNTALNAAILLKQTGLLKNIFGKDSGILINNSWKNVKTMAEFIYLLSHNLVENPAEFYKNNLKGDINTYKEIKALQVAYSNEIKNSIEARAIAHNMYLNSQQSLNSQIIPDMLKTACQELLTGKYPKSINELVVNGNDLMRLGLKGKEVGDALRMMLINIYSDKIKNNGNDLLALLSNKSINEEKKSERSEYGCLMLYLDVPNWHKLTLKIHNNDIYNVEGFGVENEPHITILYGFHDEVNADEVFSLCSKNIDLVPIKIKIIEISVFENSEFDVVKFDIESETLTKLNKIVKELPHTNKYSNYHPHMTIAYVKKGMGKKYMKKMKNIYELSGDELVYSWKGHKGKEGGKVLKLNGGNEVQ